MTPHYADGRVTLHHGDCLDVLHGMLDASVDAVVTDPPYNLTAGKKGGTGVASVNLESPYGRSRIGTGNGSGGFMGQAWDDYDHFPGGFYGWCQAWAAECLRVLKPGGHLLAFGGTRTWHRLACAVEDAGFEIRDSIAWLYGSGFPKSLDVSKAIDKAAGAEREVVGPRRWAGRMPNGGALGQMNDDAWIAKTDEEIGGETAPATDAAREWQGWGTALKPAFEPVVVARKPLVGTVAANVLTHGTGALNIDGCRIEGPPDPHHVKTTGQGNGLRSASGLPGGTGTVVPPHPAGRWPANVILDEDQAAALDQQSGTLTSGANPTRRGADGDRQAYGAFGGQDDANPQRGTDTGGASRFFYVAKADASERPRVDGTAHPTVKPLALMRWLVRLVTPPGGTVLDPFAGSGTTAEAALIEGFPCIVIEKTPEYLPLILARIHRRRNPVEAIRLAGEDLGLFDLDQEETA